VSIEYVDIVDYIAIAAEVSGLNVDTVIRLPNLPLAESALHAPAAGFGDEQFYPDFIGKAAVLITRLTRNHPLPDGNKRAAWVTLRLFIEINDWSWDPTPTVNEAEHAVLAITAGDWTEQQTANWLRAHLAPPQR
jgi:death-on-curing protein